MNVKFHFHGAKLILREGDHFYVIWGKFEQLSEGYEFKNEKQEKSKWYSSD